MKKVILSVFVIASFVAYSWHARTNQESKVSTPAPASSNNSNTTSAGAQMAVSTAKTNATTTSSPYKDGSFTGDAADAYYGNVQVRVTVNGGKITDLEFVQYPNDRHESIRINEQAMPYLKQEAITAQNEHIDGVSGATDTSAAFIQSLTSALNRARA